MGFFSKACNHCGLSILSNYAVSQELFNAGGDYLTKVVYLNEGVLFTGEYTGYGEIVSDSGASLEEVLMFDDKEIVYHEICWHLAGKPSWSMELNKHRPCNDQGFFFDTADYLPTLNRIIKEAHTERVDTI